MKLLIGYGSTLHQDDGIGWFIASRFQTLDAMPDIRVIATTQLLPELAAETANASHVVFVDATLGADPGSIHTAEIHPAVTLADAHTLLPQHILYLASALYRHTPRAYLVTITGLKFDLGEGLSNPVAAAVPNAIATIKHLLAE